MRDSRNIVGLIGHRAQTLTRFGKERNFGLIGRVIYAVFLVAALAANPAWAQTPDLQTPSDVVTWHRDGVLTWQRLERRALRPTTITRLNTNLAPGRTKVIARGRAGIIEVSVLYSQRGGEAVREQILSKTVIRRGAPRIVAEGIDPTTLAAFEARGIAHMASLARGAMLMLATAYTAGSAGGSGMTAIGRRAGFGIVAVDPRVIPLGTRLYIPGYGLAIAGDTGGDIVGNRIDLGFDSLAGAMLFGRRDITVYRLK
jgi:3D (Asp-Asp-Asp) domain-containing protein